MPQDMPGGRAGLRAKAWANGNLTLNPAGQHVTGPSSDTLHVRPAARHRPDLFTETCWPAATKERSAPRSAGVMTHKGALAPCPSATTRWLGQMGLAAAGTPARRFCRGSRASGLPRWGLCHGLANPPAILDLRTQIAVPFSTIGMMAGANGAKGRLMTKHNSLSRRRLVQGAGAVTIS